MGYCREGLEREREVEEPEGSENPLQRYSAWLFGGREGKIVPFSFLIE